MEKYKMGDMIKTKKGDKAVIVDIIENEKKAIIFNLSKMQPGKIAVKDIKDKIEDENCKVVVEKIQINNKNIDEEFDENVTEDDYNEQIDDLEEELDELEDENKELREELYATEDEKIALKNKNEELEEENDKLSDRLFDARDELMVALADEIDFFKKMIMTVLRKIGE